MNITKNEPGVIKRRGGHRAHMPTPESREKVRMLKLVGATDEQIGRILGISADSLVKHYKQDLDDGKAEILGKVAQTLYQKALDGDVTSCIFLLKTKAKFTERLEIDQINQPNVLVIDTSEQRPLDDYTDEELLALATSPEPPPRLH